MKPAITTTGPRVIPKNPKPKGSESKDIMVKPEIRIPNPMIIS
jgi:hypothetical protein